MTGWLAASYVITLIKEETLCSCLSGRLNKRLSARLAVLAQLAVMVPDFRETDNPLQREISEYHKDFIQSNQQTTFQGCCWGQCEHLRLCTVK